jgi:hypothetical protein
MLEHLPPGIDAERQQTLERWLERLLRESK